jgi:hypothetical protein
MRRRLLCLALALGLPVFAEPTLELKVAPVEAGLADVVRCELIVTAPLTAKIQLPSILPAFDNLELVERIDSPVTVSNGRQRQRVALMLQLIDARAANVPAIPVSVVDGDHSKTLTSQATGLAFKSYLPQENTELQPIYDDVGTTSYAIWLALVVLCGAAGGWYWRMQRQRASAESMVETPAALAAVIREIDPALTPSRYYDAVNRKLWGHLFPDVMPGTAVATGELVRRLQGAVESDRQQLGKALAELAERRYTASTNPQQRYGETVAEWLIRKEVAA